MTAIILAGGKSSRIRQNKAFLKIGDTTIIEHIIAKLKALFKNIIIVCNTPSEYMCLGVRVVKDIIPHKGPLGGIFSGLSFSPDLYNFVVACDMPLLNLELIRYMCKQTQGYDLVIPRLDGRYEPLHAIYSKNCCVPIKWQLEENNLKIIDFFTKIKVKEIGKQEVKRFDPSFRSFFNMNTVEDFKKIA